MNLHRRLLLLLPLALAGSRLSAKPKPAALIVGSYDLPRMKAIKGLTFPRILLYDHLGALIPRDHWPKELDALRNAAGDAFCCVSDQPTPPGWEGPPPDCEIVVYGENIDEHFVGLKDANKRSIRRSDLPSHRYLIVEYYASWCGPCLPAREALEAFLATPKAAVYQAVVVDFTRLAEA